MKRNVRMEEISDGRLYHSGDMVKADCGGCEGCSVCCHGMGNSILLDPLDAFRLSNGCACTFQELLNRGSVTLNVTDGLILPNLSMSGPEEACAFLDASGRCSIHAFRPGFCRLFPLGRYYENQTFQYFLQTKECPKKGKTKIKIYKWLDTPDLKRYEAFVSDWHYFLTELQEQLAEIEDDALIHTLHIYLLRSFYLTSWSESGDFYEQFHARLSKARSDLNL